MNILLIGNGFDLAHELQTFYEDFLRFTEEFEIYRTAIEKKEILNFPEDKDIRFFKYFIEL